MTAMTFKEGCELEIGQDVKKKGKFSYLSWSRAIEHLRINYPEATWIVHEWENAPFLLTSLGYFVKASVHLDGKVYSQTHPVLDNKNNPIKEPTTFQINTSNQRCVVKAIALATGIGIKLYSGEDLPVEQEEEKLITEEQVVKIKDFLEDERCSEADLLKWAGVEKVGLIPVAKYSLAIAGLTRRLVDND